MTACAMTDHGNMYGAVSFYSEMKKHEIKPLIGCCVPGQLIYTAEGVKPIEEIQPGELVLTHEGRFRPVRNVMTRRYHGALYGLNATLSNTLWLTDEHPILTTEGVGKEMKWKRADEITAGRRNRRGGVDTWRTYVAFPRLGRHSQETQTLRLTDYLDAAIYAESQGKLVKSGKFNKWDKTIAFDIPARVEVTPDLMRLLGLFIAEGSFQRDSSGRPTCMTFSFGSPEVELAVFVRSALKSIFNLNSRESLREDKHIREVYCSSAILARLFQQLCGSGCSEKRIPGFVYNASKKHIASFVGGVVDGDGRRTHNRGGYTVVRMVSRNVVHGLKLLVGALGHGGVVSESKVDGRRNIYTLTWSTTPSFRHFLHDERFLLLPLKSLAHRDYDGPVYNIEVEEDSSYVSDIVLHNCEVYLAPNSRFDKKDAQKGEKPYNHMILLAKDREGYHNLVRLTSKAFKEGFYRKPRIDRELLSQFGGGLIGLSACLSGVPQAHLKAGRLDAAEKAAHEFQDILGKGNYFLEIQDHQLPDQQRINKDLIELSARSGIPLVATNDAHYLFREDYEAHDVMLCIGTGRTVNDTDRMRFGGPQWYVRSPEEMREIFTYCPDAVTRTAEVAEMCNLKLPLGENHLPVFPIPPAEGDISSDDYFEKVVREGYEKRRATVWDAMRAKGTLEHDPHEYQARVSREIEMIKRMGFPCYFLIVWDFIKFAKDRAIPVGPGRGSAAGSLVAYCLEITDVDPLQYDLLFERFLNPDRVSMPDIDIDFCVHGRGEVINHVSQLYGRESVCQIITFGTMASKAAIKDVGRALDMPYADVEKIAKLIPPPIRGRNVSINQALEMVPELKQAFETDEQTKKVIDIAKRLEGCARHSSVHAAGVVISPRPLEEMIPVAVNNKQELTTQFEMSDLEKTGMLKMDFLGLTTLSIISQCCKTISELHGTEIKWSEIPLDDAKTYEIFAQGRTDAVFQFESSGMQEICRKLRPKSIEDLSALNALYRPGPLDGGMVDDFIDRYHGRKPIEYLTSEMDEILNNTYGVCVYQEQIMQLAQKLGGYSLGEADLMRRAMGKKKREEMAVHEEKFIAGCVKNKIIKKKAKEIFRLMAQFADYGFNKSHSVAYAHVAYQTAYLKAHYLEHFYAAVMTYQADDAAKIFKYASELRAQGIRMLPPDVNESGPGFTPVEGAIRFGLAAIKGIGQTAVAPIIEARKEKSFTSIFDFAERVGEKGTGKRVLESLVAAGAFDSLKNAGEDLHQWRASLHATVDKALASGASRRRERESGQFDMFGGLAAGGNDGAAAEMYRPLEKAPAWTHRELLVHEKATVGFYVSGHPLEDHAERIEELNCMTVADLAACGPDTRVRLAGVVSDFNVRNTKKGDRYAMFRLEDVSGVSVKCVLWPEAFKTKGQDAANDAVILAAGRLDGGGDTSQTVVCDEVVLLEKAKIPSHATWTNPSNRRAPSQAIAITLPAGDDLAKVSEAVVGALIAHPGDCEVFIDLPLEEEGFTVRAKAAGFIKVRPTQRLRDDLTAAGVRFEMIDTKPAV